MTMDTPVFNARSLFPRRHPSAWMAAGLGLASFVMGPIVGVPGLLLSRRVRVETVRNRGHLTGLRLAVVGEIGAWISTIVWAIAGAMGFVAMVPAFTYVIPLCAGVLAVTLYLRRQPPWLVGVAGLGGLIAALGGGQIHHKILEGRAVARMQACDAANQSADSAWRARDYREAQSLYERAAVICVGDTARGATASMQYIAAVTESSAVVESARGQWADTSEIAREYDRQASARVRLRGRFVAAEATAGSRLIEARRLAGAKKWEKAAAVLADVEGQMKPFEGTEMGATPEWHALDADRRSIEESVRPGLDAVSERRRAADVRKAEAAALREERLSDRVECCDGSLSPSCRYSQGSLRGCCSYHGGVC